MTAGADARNRLADRSRELRDWLTLARTPGLGPRIAKQLLAAHGGASGAVDAGPAAWRAAGLPEAGRQWLAAPDEALLAADAAWLEAPDRHLVVTGDAHYPPALAELDDAPPWLFAAGDLDLLTPPAFAVVGSRNPSRDGIENARAFAAELAHAGLAVVSGLADGIDAAAHQGALDAYGMTIAVCGTGLDRVYPARNRALAQRIAASGLLLSEFALGTPPLRPHFPRRNRIIAGLSAGTLVIEAARNSGSLITARLALEYGREVFALPGSIHNPLARGCHRLIREGAKLVETGADILEEVAPQLQLLPSPSRRAPDTPAPAGHSEPDPEHRKLLDHLGHAPTRVDELVERSGLTPDAVSSILLILELQGLVASGPGGTFTRTR